jgi:hypothetical protein
MGIATLSSSSTFMWKFIFPILWITGFGIWTFAAWTGRLVDNQGVPLPFEIKYNLLFGLIAGSLLILWSIARLKRIRTDDHSIYISNYRKEISVPLGAIADITEYWWFNPTLITSTSDTRPSLGIRLRSRPSSGGHF